MMNKKLILSIAVSVCMFMNTAVIFAETATNTGSNVQTQQTSETKSGNETKDANKDSNKSTEKEENKNSEKNTSKRTEEDSDRKDSEYSREDVLGESKTDLEGGYSLVGAKESNYANLINDAVLSKTKADVSLINAGTILKSIKAGTIKYEDVSSSLMFGTIVVTKELTGKEIKSILEQGAEIYPESNSRFIQPGKLSYTIDPNKKAGERITSIKVNGSNINSSKKYTVAVNDYMLSDYRELSNAKTVKEYESLDKITADYIKEKKTVNYKADGRIKAEKIQAADESKIKKLISDINALTYDKTESNIKKVNEAVKAYNALSDSDQKKITNVSRLKDIVKKLNSSGSNVSKPSSSTSTSSSKSSTATQKSPKTGDPSIAVPLAVFAVSGMGLFAIRKNNR